MYKRQGEELPFIFSQLAPFDNWMNSCGMYYPILRQEQHNIARSVKKCYMVSISDAGDALDIHPSQKQPVGRRMALKALHYVYGQPVVCDYPELESVEVADGEIRLAFRNGEGLYLVREQRLHALDTWVDGKRAVIDGCHVSDGEVVLLCAKVRKDSEVSLRFADRPYYKVNLYNGAHIPAVPFVFDSEKTV